MPIENPSPTTTGQPPLAGLRVLDLSRVLAGPWCGQALADLGADVIKVERPGTGDDTRQWGPPFVTGPDGEDNDAAYYLAANRGKRSIEIDIATEAGQQVVRTLAAGCDVLIENYKVGQLARYGLDAGSMLELNPRLVYCSITGFGQTGPWAHRAGYDFIIQALGGFMSITGEADDRPGGGPQKAGVAIADLMTGMYATQAILAALHARERTGRGQSLDIGLLDAQVAMLANMATNHFVSGENPRRWGNAHPNIVPYEAFRAQDQWIILAIGNDGQFQRFCTEAGRDALASDPRFAKAADRVRHREELLPLIRDIVLERTADAWIGALEALAVPCGVINTLDRVFTNEQVVARGLEVELTRKDGTPVRMVRYPVKFSDTPTGARRAPPRLGEDAAEILSEFGFDETTLRSLARAGAFGADRTRTE